MSGLSLHEESGTRAASAELVSPIKPVGSDQRRWRGRGVTVSVAGCRPVTPVRLNRVNHQLWVTPWTSGARFRLDFRPAGSPSSVTVPQHQLPGTTLVELEPWFVEDTLGTDLCFPEVDDWGDRKAAVIIENMRDAVSSSRHPTPTLEALAMAVCRALPGARFGEMVRLGDAWMHPAALRRVVELVEDRLAEPLRVEALAAASGLGASAFLRAFRGTLGLTPGGYVTARRVARAEAMLKSTDLPIALIGAVCGFGTPAYFSTTFRSRRGIQPITLRQAVRLATPTTKLKDSHERLAT